MFIGGKLYMDYESKFFMLRSLIAIAHIDGRLHPSEIEYIREIVELDDFAEDERKIIENCFQRPEDIALLAPKIVDTEEKIKLLYFAHILVYVDQELHPTEKDVITRLHYYFAKDENIDVDFIKKTTQMFLERHGYISSNNEAEMPPTENINDPVQWFKVYDELMADIGYEAMHR